MEQLLAESTGKNGKAVIPIVGEPLGAPSTYDARAIFIYLRDAAQSRTRRRTGRSAHSRKPVIRWRALVLPTSKSLAQEFFRFEIATAVAGAVLGINPFDQPDVEASKIATRAITETFEKTGALPFEQPVFETDRIALFMPTSATRRCFAGSGAGSTLESWFKALLGQLTAGDYFALLAFLDAGKAQTQALQNIRIAVRDRTRAATCLQFGPRYLHSTGQAYKGGPNSGCLSRHHRASQRSDLAIPGRKATFGTIEAAQARGDFRVLAERGRRISARPHHQRRGCRTCDNRQSDTGGADLALHCESICRSRRISAAGGRRRQIWRPRRGRQQQRSEGNTLCTSKTVTQLKISVTPKTIAPLNSANKEDVSRAYCSQTTNA